MFLTKFIFLTISIGYVKSHQLCNGEDYVNGKWVEDVKLWKDPSQNFICCGAENGGNKNLSHVCKPGLFIEDHGCTCMANYMKETLKVSDKYIFSEGKESEYRYQPNSVKYSWQPSNCELPNWNAHKFCKVLGKQKVLIIGDSTSYQISGVIKNMISQANSSDNSLYKCAQQFEFHFSDCLVTFENRRHGGCGRGGSIANDIIEEGSKGNFFDIVIFGNFHGVGLTDAFNYNVTDPRFADAMLVKLVKI